MKVESVFLVKGRGYVVGVRFSEVTVLPDLPFSLRRTSDGREWVVTGVERYCMRRGRPTSANEPVGFLVRGEDPPSEHDDVVIEKDDLIQCTWCGRWGEEGEPHVCASSRKERADDG